MAAYGQMQGGSSGSINFSRLSMQSLQLYAEEHQLDVRPGATLPELTVGVAHHFDYVLDVDEDFVLSRFVNIAKRGQDDRSRSSGVRPAAEAGHKRRRAGLPEPADTDVGTYSGEMYSHEMDHMDAHHMAKTQAVGAMPPQQQPQYMYDMQHPMQPQQWPSATHGYGQAPLVPQHPHHMMGGGMHQHPQQQVPPRHMQESDTPTGDQRQQEDDSLYCLCQRPSFGQMIGCDGKDCPFEWFHQPCVNLPEGYEVQGKWYCPECRATPVDHGKQAPLKVRKQRKLDREANRRSNGGPEFAHLAQQAYHPQG